MNDPITQKWKDETIKQAIAHSHEQHKQKAFEQCLRRGFHKPYPDGYYERCFACGAPLTLTLLKEDRQNELKSEFLGLISQYTKNEDVDMFRLYRVAHELGISV